MNYFQVISVIPGGLALNRPAIEKVHIEEKVGPYVPLPPKPSVLVKYVS